jgi:YidC/Oxa1 family membrane protein insertase
LTKPYMESMKKMKLHTEDLNKLKKKHKGDRQKLMKAQADFYKSKGINPGAGCLPYLLQIVILIALFRVFTNVLSVDNGSIDKINTLLYSPLKITNESHLNTNFLYFDLTRPDAIKIVGLPFSLPGLLVILAAVAQLVNVLMSMPYLEAEKRIAKKTKEADDDMAAAMQSSMIYTFPLLTLIAGMSFPSGLALYWFLFSAIQVYSQYKNSGWGKLAEYKERIDKWRA